MNSMFPRTSSGLPRIALVAAARPNFMKVASVLRALDDDDADVDLVHTGQHYDQLMSDQFFEDLRLPDPDVHLGIGSATHAEQTADVMVAFERYLSDDRRDAVVVVGDVNSTVACAMAAVKLHIPVAHVEAGLRSGDWQMPEEINRVLTDRISQWLFTPSEDADCNLEAEGVPTEWIHRVGNVMVDTLLANLDRARERAPRIREGLDLGGDYGVITMHRPSNVDEADALRRMFDVLGVIGDDVPLVFPVHPRTRKELEHGELPVPSGIRMVKPLGYLDFIGLLDGARIALTDSGGIQEETSVLGVPCVTMRTTTERPITCELGTNVLVGTEPEAVLDGAQNALRKPREPATIPLWDGRSGQRIAKRLLEDLSHPILTDAPSSDSYKPSDSPSNHNSLER